MTSNISYKGNVVITIKTRPPVKKHNNGTSILFNTLNNILSGVFAAADMSKVNVLLPQYMSLIHNDNGQITSEVLNHKVDYTKYQGVTLVSEPLILTSKIVNSDNSVSFASLLSHSQTITTVQNVDDCYVLLIDGNNRILAYSGFRFADVEPVFTDPNGQASIDWSMSFSNKEYQ